MEIANKRAMFESRGLYTSNVNTETTEHFIYMIREREFINDDVYKIGRSSMKIVQELLGIQKEVK